MKGSRLPGGFPRGRPRPWDPAAERGEIGRGVCRVRGEFIDSGGKGAARFGWSARGSDAHERPASSVGGSWPLARELLRVSAIASDEIVVVTWAKRGGNCQVGLKLNRGVVHFVSIAKMLPFRLPQKRSGRVGTWNRDSPKRQREVLDRQVRNAAESPLIFCQVHELALSRRAA